MPKKIVVDVPEDMYDALIEEKDKTGVPVSSQVRLSVQKYFARKGKKVSAKVGNWGGSRDAEPESQPAAS